MLAASVRTRHQLSYNKAWVTSLQINFLIYPQKHTTFFSVTQKQVTISFSSSICIYGSCQDSLLHGQSSPSEEERAELPAPRNRGAPGRCRSRPQLRSLGPQSLSKPPTTRETRQLFTSLHPPKRLVSLCLRRWFKE